VVKAAKVQKPLFYASPEVINQAAAAREAGRLSTGTACENILSFPKYNHYTSGTYSSADSSSSSSSSSTTSSSSSSSVSSIDNFNKLINNDYYPFHPTSNRLTSDSGCGCGKKSSSESLEIHDLLSHNVQGKVVPRYFILFYIIFYIILFIVIAIIFNANTLYFQQKKKNLI